MPNTDRQNMQLDAKRSIEHLERAAEYVLRLRVLYDPDYPERVEAIDILLSELSDLRDVFIDWSRTI